MVFPRWLIILTLRSVIYSTPVEGLILHSATGGAQSPRGTQYGNLNWPDAARWRAPGSVPCCAFCRYNGREPIWRLAVLIGTVAVVRLLHHRGNRAR